MSKNFVVIGGSNSIHSINKKLAKAAAKKLANSTYTVVDINEYEMPIYSIDRENTVGFPAMAKELDELFQKCDGFIISLPEHNGSYSVAFKNILDWTSRIEGKVWRDKPMLLMTASPGGRGGQTMMEIAEAKFPRMGASLVGTLTFGNFYDNYTDGKGVTNAELDAKIAELVQALENHSA